MQVRRLQYQIDFVHIITFKDEYKRAVAPYFTFDNLEYGVDNEGSIHEGIRLVFKIEQIAIGLRKEAITLAFSGNPDELKNQNGVMKFFWDLYEKVKRFEGYTRTTRHHLIAYSVDIMKDEEVDTLLTGKSYLAKNPFGKLNEFACVYEFRNDDTTFKAQVGNYSDKDIKIHDLMPFKTKENEDLPGGVGLMARIEITEPDASPSFSKFKSLLQRANAKLKDLTE